AGASSQTAGFAKGFAQAGNRCPSSDRAPMIAPSQARHRRLGGALGGNQVIDPRAQILEDEILLGRRLAVVDFLGPLLERKLDAECLVDREGDVQKVKAIDAEVVDGVTFGLDRVALDVARLRDDAGYGVEGG